MKLSTLEFFLKKAKELNISPESTVSFGGRYSVVENIHVNGEKNSLHIYKTQKDPSGVGRDGYEIVIEDKVFFENEDFIK